jgi:hypothetical protein
MNRQLSSMTRYGRRLAALWVLVGCAGCVNPFAPYQRRTTGMDFYGQRTVTYYHYPHGSWFVPAQQRHHCPTIIEELPFHGFSPTCWNAWPEGWQACPPPGTCAIPPGAEVIEHPLPPPPLEQPLPLPQAKPPVRSSKETIPDEVLRLGEKLAFRGKVGFSEPDDKGSSAVAIDLSPRSNTKDATLQELKASVKTAE